MTLERQEEIGTYTSYGAVPLPDPSFRVFVDRNLLSRALKDPELLVDTLSAKVGEVVDSIIENLPTREQLLDYVFGEVAKDFGDIFQNDIPNPYREEIDPYLENYAQQPGPSLATVDKIMKEAFLHNLKVEFEKSQEFMDKFIGVHPVSKGPATEGLSKFVESNTKLQVEPGTVWWLDEISKYKFVPPDDFYPGKSAFSPLIPVQGMDLYSGHLNSPYGLFEVIVDPTIPKNQIRVGTAAYKGLEAFSKPLNDVHEQYQAIIKKITYDQPVKFVNKYLDDLPLKTIQDKNTKALLKYESNNHWWKKKGGKK